MGIKKGAKGVWHGIERIRSMSLRSALAERKVSDFQAYFSESAERERYGIILVERQLPASAGKTFDLKLHVVKKSGGQGMCAGSFPVKVSRLEKMFRSLNFLSIAGRLGRKTQLTELENSPDKLCTNKNSIFGHGYNISPEQARGWNAEVFK